MACKPLNSIYGGKPQAVLTALLCYILYIVSLLDRAVCLRTLRLICLIRTADRWIGIRGIFKSIWSIRTPVVVLMAAGAAISNSCVAHWKCNMGCMAGGNF